MFSNRNMLVMFKTMFFFNPFTVKVTEIFHIIKEIFLCNYITMQNLSDNHILVILFIIVIVLCCQRLLCMFDDYVMMGNADWALSKMYECTMYLIRNEIRILWFFLFWWTAYAHYTCIAAFHPLVRGFTLVRYFWFTNQ